MPRIGPRTQAFLAAGVLCTSVLSLAAGVEWVSAWFYDLAWWSTIVLVDALVALRRGSSLLRSRPRTFLLLALWSAAFWLLFEAANFRLENWYYVGVPRDLFSRGPGVLVSFATVLPAIFELYELASAYGWFAGARSRPFTVSAGMRRASLALGVLFLLAPLAFPRTAYPLIWGASVLLAEPWLAARGERSLWTTLSRGDPRPTLRLLAAGLAAGFLWEAFNHGATAKWIYTVPGFEELKLFEMPVAGFLGFPPFALECYTFGRVLVALGLVPEWELGEGAAGAPRALGRRAVLAAGAALLASVPLIAGVNRWTLRATRPELDEVAALVPSAAQGIERLRERGIGTVRALLAAADGRGKRAGTGAMDLGTPEERAALEPAIAAARLMQVRGLGARGARALHAAGIRDVGALSRADAAELAARLEAALAAEPAHWRPRPAEVREWVRAARALSAGSSS